MSNTSKAVVFVLAGMAAGVTLGMLFAPAKGKENREKLGTTLSNLGETIIDSASGKIDVIKVLTDSLVTPFKGKNNNFTHQYDDIEHAIL